MLILMFPVGNVNDAGWRVFILPRANEMIRFGTIIEEHIVRMAGATSPQMRIEAEMITAIREAGRTPVQRNTFCEPIRVNPPCA